MRKDAEKLGLIPAGENAEWWPLWKMLWQFLNKSNRVTIGLEIPPVGIYPRNMRPYAHSRTCTWMSMNSSSLQPRGGSGAGTHLLMRLYVPPVAQDSAMKGARL